MLELRNISKSFPGVKALQNVSLNFNAGEIHAICGENGAGKTTLMNIISGNIQPDSGSIFLNGKEITIENVLHAQSIGISIVYQERSLVDSLSVAENIFPVNQPKKSGLINHPALFRQAKYLLHELKIEGVSPNTLVGKLSAAQKGMVEIAKALAQKPAVIILDEPTASITHEETVVLFSLIKRLKQNNVSVIYISHRMSEIKEIADVVTVLKDGKFQGTVDASTNVSVIVKLMVGRELTASKYQSDTLSEVLIDVQNISGKGFENISFKIHKGEIVGFAGLTGSGRTELAKAIFGETKFHSGCIFIKQKLYKPAHPHDAIKQHVAYLPDDRKAEGLFLENSISENFASVHLDKTKYDAHANRKIADTFINHLGIKTRGANTTVKNLSGGNQQKVMLAKWLTASPDLLIINEPTHGVDVGAKADIYNILKALTKEQKGIIMISSELPELLLLADRIVVMYQGRITGVLPKQEATEERIAALSSGIV
jgi:ABC-type sugar transport system ATPase subunit